MIDGLAVCNIEINHRNAVIEEVVAENHHLKRSLARLRLKVTLLDGELDSLIYGRMKQHERSDTLRTKRERTSDQD